MTESPQPSHEAPLAAAPRPRLRFSLLTLLLLLTIAALAVTVWRQSFEIEPLRQEVRRLRQEVGHLSIDDPHRIYAIQVSQMQSNIRRYRVYLPNDRKYQIHLGLGEVAGRPRGQSKNAWLKKVAEASSGSSGGIQSGESTLDVEVRRDPDGATKDHWEIVYQINGAGGGKIGTEIAWLNDRRAWSIAGDVGLEQQVERVPTDGIVLYALRKAEVKELPHGYTTAGTDDTKDTPGLILWIIPDSAQ